MSNGKKRTRKHLVLFQRLLIASVLALLLVAAGCGSNAGSGATSGTAQPPTSGSGDQGSSGGGTGSGGGPSNETPAPENETDFRGKTIEVVVNYTAGGPTDTFNRLIAQYVGKYIPGNPTIVVRNVGGAGGMIGANQVFTSPKKDGTVIGGFTMPIIQQILGEEGAQYKVEEFEWLASVQESEIFYARGDVGAKTPADLMNPAKPIVFGGLRPSSTNDLLVVFYLKGLGVQYDYVHGYPGIADIRKAFLQNEINLMGNSLTDYFGYIHPMVEKGEVDIIGQSGLLTPDGKIIRDDRISDVPTTLEVLEQVKGSVPFSDTELAALRVVTAGRSLLRGIVAPPGTDPAAVATLRKAYDQALTDPEFLAAAEEQLSFKFDYVPGPDAKKLAENMLADTKANPDLVTLLQEMAGLK